MNSVLATLIIFTTSLATVGCRPKDRSLKVVGERSIFTVNIINMSEITNQNYKYRLAGCLDVDGKIFEEKKQITFENRSIKKGLGGCYIEVTDPTRNSDKINFTESNGVFWISKKFSVGRNTEGKLFANADMRKIYENKLQLEEKNFSLQVPISLPQGTKIEFLTFNAIMKCTAPFATLEVKDVNVKDDLNALLYFDNLKVPVVNDIVTCSKISLVGSLQGKQMKFEGVLKEKNQFTPVEGLTLSLNSGDGRYLLSLISSDFDQVAPTDIVNVDIIEGPCKENHYINKDYDCVPCTDTTTDPQCEK